MSKKNRNSKEENERKIKKLIEKLKKYDGMDYSAEREEELKEIKDKLVSIGKSAVPQLIEVLSKHKWQSSWHAAESLGEIGNDQAIKPLVDALEEPELGGIAKEALKKFGPVCIPEVIKKVEYRIAHPVEEKGIFVTLTMYPLSTIGEIRCDESSKFLNKLLDDYVSEMPDETFDPSKHNWKYRNVDFFHLLDCMVKQQNKSAIPYIKRARDCFPKNYTDHKVCQIAIGRIKNGETDSSLVLEALEIAYPSGAIMSILSRGEIGWKDNFDEVYGKYFDEEYYDEVGEDEDYDEDDYDEDEYDEDEYDDKDEK